MFTNPLTTRESPDPFVVLHDGYYYAIECTPGLGESLKIAKSKRLADIFNVEPTTVYTSTHEYFQYSHWAPELWYLNGEWYIYTCAINGENIFNDTRRVIVLKGTSQNPQDPFEFAAELELGDYYGLDATVLNAPNGKLYLLWSGGKTIGQGYPTQVYIAEMESPTKMKIPGERVLLRETTLPWEYQLADNGDLGEGKECHVTEGPICLVRNNVVSMVYSCNGFGNENYCLGMMVCRNATDSDFRNWKWEVSPEPVFAKTDKVWGPGHNSFTVSPDGTETWNIYHSKRERDEDAFRWANMQKVEWENDVPILGVPVDPGVELEEPSGTESN